MARMLLSFTLGLLIVSLHGLWPPVTRNTAVPVHLQTSAERSKDADKEKEKARKAEKEREREREREKEREREREKEKARKAEAKSKTVLSFGGDEEEEGEAFKIKKTSASKRLAKETKERRKCMCLLLRLLVGCASLVRGRQSTLPCCRAPATAESVRSLLNPSISDDLIHSRPSRTAHACAPTALLSQRC